MVKYIIRKLVLPKHMKKKKMKKISKQISIIQRNYQEILNDPLYHVYNNILNKLIDKNIVNID